MLLKNKKIGENDTIIQEDGIYKVDKYVVGKDVGTMSEVLASFRDNSLVIELEGYIGIHIVEIDGKINVEVFNF